MSTKIQWTDATWNPTVGCSRVSDGCDNCYAMRFAHRALTPSHSGLTTLRRGAIDWTGEVRALPGRLSDPLGMRSPRLIFVGSMSDVFHPSVDPSFVAAILGVCAACPQHTFQMLTKRPEHAAKALAWIERLADASRCHPRDVLLRHAWLYVGSEQPAVVPRVRIAPDCPWPLPNVHLGTSAESQETWDKRVPHLLRCPAAVRWVSAEPLLEAVSVAPAAGIDWIVVGGESGHGARPFELEWAGRIMSEFSGPVFIKQLGARPMLRGRRLALTDRKGSDIEEWPMRYRVREMPCAVGSVATAFRGHHQACVDTTDTLPDDARRCPVGRTTGTIRVMTTPSSGGAEAAEKSAAPFARTLFEGPFSE